VPAGAPLLGSPVGAALPSGLDPTAEGEPPLPWAGPGVTAGDGPVVLGPCAGFEDGVFEDPGGLMADIAAPAFGVVGLAAGVPSPLTGSALLAQLAVLHAGCAPNGVSVPVDSCGLEQALSAHSGNAIRA
jgi:hypothetical protein